MGGETTDKRKRLAEAADMQPVLNDEMIEWLNGGGEQMLTAMIDSRLRVLGVVPSTVESVQLDGCCDPDATDHCCTPSSAAINIVFDGPPGPEAGRFVEVENDAGEGISVGKWIERPDGMWALRIEPPTVTWAKVATLCGHGSVICALCNFVPDSWRPQP